MANVLDRYGIKEVADVTFYELGSDGKPQYPVLFLDTLKVSTIEQTAETADARGGKGNAALISWDYNKEINVTLEDALFSVRSLNIMFGGGKSETTWNYEATTGGDTHETNGLIMRTETFTSTNATSVNSTAGSKIAAMMAANGWTEYFTAPDGKSYAKYNAKFFTLDGTAVNDGAAIAATTTYFCTYDIKVNGTIIDISANSFPGTYYITGETFARSENSGKDEFFQFIIPKAKVTSENTITLEAEGDPSVFNMSLKVLRPADGVMMKLVKYDIASEELNVSGSTSSVYHNHTLNASTNSNIPGDGDSNTNSPKQS